MIQGVGGRPSTRRLGHLSPDTPTRRGFFFPLAVAVGGASQPPDIGPCRQDARAKTESRARCSRARLVFSVRGVRTMRWCGGRRTVKRVKSAWHGNAMAMMHDRRIVNSGGRQKWHGHDHYDGPHSTLPHLAWQRLSNNTTRVRPYSMFPVKNSSRVASCAQGLSCMAITRPPLVCR